MTPERIKQFIKFQIILVFALYPFAGSSNAIAATCSLNQPIIYTENVNTYCTNSGYLGGYGGSSTNGLKYCETSGGNPGCPPPGPGEGNYLTDQLSTAEQWGLNGYTVKNANDETLYINGQPVPTTPDISSCPASVTFTRQDGQPLPSEIRTEQGCIYSPDWTNTPITGCYELDPPDPNQYYCRVDATPTGTFDPTQETGQTQPETDGTPKDTTTQLQRNTADAISDWWGLEPTQTFDFLDGRRITTYESSTGCVLEVVINPDGTYVELQDTCNVHSTDGSIPTIEPDENHTNPDGTPNTGGGSGNTGSPSGGGTSGGGDTGGGDTGGGDTGGGDTGGGDTGGGDTGGGDTGAEEPTTGEDKSGEILDWLTEPFTPEQHPDTPVEEINAEQLAVDWSSGLGSGSCPAPVTTTFQGQTIPYDLTDACMAATSIFKPVLLAISAFAATFIIAGVRT